MKLVLILFLTFSSMLANESLESIYENIVLKNTKEAQLVAKKLELELQNNEQENAKKEFTNLVKAWKSVEAFYILGDLDDNYLDTPRYLDTFHHGNEDIKVQLDRIIESSKELSKSLYKNSHKTVNALEYILFRKDISNERVKNISLIIIQRIQMYLDEIYMGYTETRESFVGNEQKANAVMLNALIETSYKIKEWRVGDPAGLSRKYKDKPDNRRAEYALSKNSLTAIEAILQTHLNILEKQKYKNLGSLIETYEVKEELSDAIKYLHLSLQESEKLKNDDFSNAKPLYKSLKKLHMTYYISLIGKLKITAKILDADGD